MKTELVVAMKGMRNLGAIKRLTNAKTLSLSSVGRPAKFAIALAVGFSVHPPYARCMSRSVVAVPWACVKVRWALAAGSWLPFSLSAGALDAPGYTLSRDLIHAQARAHGEYQCFKARARDWLFCRRDSEWAPNIIAVYHRTLAAQFQVRSTRHCFHTSWHICFDVLGPGFYRPDGNSLYLDSLKSPHGHF
ncbi:hypothetical protein PMIN07_012644 [Paraphaeosphaeria minitans]